MLDADNLPDMLTPVEVSDLLELNIGTIKDLVRSGKLERVGPPGAWDITKKSVVAYVNRKYGDGGTARFANRRYQRGASLGGPGDE